jgi:hypothetical protein
MQNCMSPIFALSTLLGPFIFAVLCINTSPSTSSVSSTVPPSLLITLTSCEDHIKCYNVGFEVPTVDSMKIMSSKI